MTKPKVVTVTMTDFHFKLAGLPVKHGVPVTFKVVNKGGAIHNFDIQSVKASKLIGPGKTTTIKVTFKKAGKYPYVSTSRATPSWVWPERSPSSSDRRTRERRAELHRAAPARRHVPISNRWRIAFGEWSS